MRYLICYDISDNKTRTRVAKYLESFAFRIQYSVFLCENTEQGIREVTKRLHKLTRQTSRKMILITPICKNCARKVHIIGTAIESLTYCVVA